MKKQYNQEIQVLRAIAVLAVVFHHIPTLFFWDMHRWEIYGRGLWVGVDLFFCISGYVIARSLIPTLAGKSGSAFWRAVGAFWLRRLYRITPSAWLWVIVVICVSPFLSMLGIRGLDRGNISDFAAIALHVANLHFYECSKGATNCGDFGWYWTLSLEEQFYIALPFIVLFAGRRLVPVLVICVLAQLFLPRPPWGAIGSFLRTDAIMLGVLLAIFCRTEAYRVLEPRLNSSMFRFIIPPALVFLLFATTTYQIVSFSLGIVAIVSALLVWLASYEQGYFFKASVLRRFMVWVGSRSYAIYLIHIPAYWATEEIWKRIEPTGTQFGSNYTLRFVLTATVLIGALAELNYRFVELPLIEKRSTKGRLTYGPIGIGRRARRLALGDPYDSIRSD